MPTGFGIGPFGIGGFGHWNWPENAIVQSIPDIYKAQDEEVGNYALRDFLRAVAGSMEELRQQIQVYDNLRDPLLCQTERTLSLAVTIIGVVRNTDGTSNVYLSNGANSDVFALLRIGQVLTDSAGNRFDVIEVRAAGQTAGLTYPPVDPWTSAASGKYVVVSNIASGLSEIIPLVSGPTYPDESVVTVGSPPYTFTLAHVPIAYNRVSLSWSEVAGAKTGAFNNDGTISGDVGLSSTIDYTNGNVRLYTKSGDAIVPMLGPLLVTYTRAVWKDEVAVGVPPAAIGAIPVDALVNSQNLLAILSQDFGVSLDRHDSDVSQRSYVFNSWQLWDLKGTEDGYYYCGQIANFFVKASQLFSISSVFVSRLPAEHVFTIGGKLYTDIAPRRPVFDDVPADLCPTDLFTFDLPSFPGPPPPTDGYPTQFQAVFISSSTFVRFEGGKGRYEITVAPLSSDNIETLTFPPASLIDSASQVFELENCQRLSDSTYQAEVLGLIPPVVSLVVVGTVQWKAPHHSLLTEVVVDFGPQYVGYTGHRYRISASCSAVLPEVGVLGRWAYVDERGHADWVDAVVETGWKDFGLGVVPYITFEIVSDTVPVVADYCFVFYAADVVTGCDFCATSSLRFLLTALPAATAEELSEDGCGRLIIRLDQMVPRHVKALSYVYDPGPSHATFLIDATGTIAEVSTEIGPVTAFFDVGPPSDRDADVHEVDPDGYLTATGTAEVGP